MRRRLLTLLLRRHASGGAADLPPEYERFYRGRVPVPRSRASAADTAAAGEAAPSTSGAPAQDVMNDAQAAAAAATTWMFPWERRQLEGGPGGLRPWEKVYWGLFVTALAGLGYSRLLRTKDAPPPPTDDAREAARRAAVRPLLAGAPLFVLDDEPDPFDGDSPEEVEAYVAAHAGVVAGSADRFEGLEPHEIEALLKEHGQ